MALAHSAPLRRGDRELRDDLEVVAEERLGCGGKRSHLVRRRRGRSRRGELRIGRVRCGCAPPPTGWSSTREMSCVIVTAPIADRRNVEGLRIEFRRGECRDLTRTGWQTIYRALLEWPEIAPDGSARRTLCRECCAKQRRRCRHRIELRATISSSACSAANRSASLVPTGSTS